MRALLIGRFQPFHNGHFKLVHHFLKKDYEIIIGIGSAQESYTPHNPFTAGERYLMISQALAGTQCHIIPIPDIHRYGIWVSHVEDLVPPFDVVLTNNPLLKELFMRDGYAILGTPLYQRKKLCGTEIRSRILLNQDWKSLVPQSVAHIIKAIGGIQRIKLLSTTDK